MPRKLKIFLIIIFFIIFIIFCVLYFNYNNNKFEVIFFNVGQGDSALINLPGNNEILIDGGPDKTVLYKLNKYLPVYNRDIELMILTHPHADHTAGLIEVLKRYNIKKIMYTGIKYDSEIYKEFINIINKKLASHSLGKGGNIKIIKPEDFDKIKLDDKNILKIIYPRENLENKNFSDLNDSSIVFKLDTPEKDFLFTGDITVAVEKEILNNINNNLLRADILKVAHQGSITSSSEEFIKAVSPAFAVIPVGENNFGHPSLRVIRRLERIGAKVLRTDQSDIAF